MGRMATWKDGAAYAPIERPDGFATPVADPLPSGAPYQAPTPGPLGHPQGFEPMPAQPPLGEIGPTRAAARDPRDAFAVASSLITVGPDGVPAGPRDPRTPFPTAARSPLDTSPPPPTGAPLAPPPGAPLAPPSNELLPSGPAQPGDLASYPPPAMPGQPGTAPVPANGPPQMQPAPAVDPSLRTLARVASGLCLVGFFAAGAAAFMLTVAGVIGLRTKALTKALGSMALSSGVGGLLLQFTLNPYDWRMFSGLWGLIALGCAIGFLVYSLKER